MSETSGPGRLTASSPGPDQATGEVGGPIGVGPRRVTFSLLLAGAMTVSTFAMPTLSVLSGLLLADLGITRSQLGWLITLTAATAAVLAPLAGRMTDGFGGRRLMLAIFGTSLAAMLAMVVAPNYWALVAVVILAGLPNAAGNPTTNKLIAVHTPPGSRGTIMGIKQSGVPAGIFLAGATLPTLALWLGWRGAVALAMAVPAVGLVAAWWFLPRDRPPRDPQAAAVRYHHGGPVRWTAAYAFLMGAGGSAVMSFLPLYGHETLGLTVPVAGAAVSALGLMGVPARILWARQTDRSGRHSRALTLMAVMSAFAAAGILLADIFGLWLLWVSVVLAGLTMTAWNAVVNLAAVALSGEQHAGRASGLVLLGFMGGFTLSPVLVGWSVDVLGSYRPAWTATILTFSAAASLMLVWHRATAGSGSLDGATR